MAIAIALLVIGGLVLWGRMRAGAAPVSMRRLPCKWARHADGDKPGFAQWRCAKCGVEAYSLDTKGPQDCKRGLASRPL